MRRARFVWGVAAAVVLACVDPAFAQLQLVPYVTSGLDAPLELVQDPVTPGIKYVVEQAGLIVVVKDGVLLPQPFLDLTGAVHYDQSEQGLLSLTFAPDYATSGRFFVLFSSEEQGPGDSVLARFTRSANDPLVADPDSRLDFEWSPGQRSIPQPTIHHKGGRMIFGPTDGYLYVALGDGVFGDDPLNASQNPTLLLGKMLRLDVNVDASDTKGYRIPADNPFVDGHIPGVLGEIWSFGFRNPWRYSIDDPSHGGTGAFIFGDVGQSTYEEIDYEPAGRGGRNYGWPLREGAHPYTAPSGPAAFTPLTDPIYDYGRTLGGCVIGGVIYRGAALDPSFKGRYFFADYLAHHLFAFTPMIDPGTLEAAAVDPSQVTDLTTMVGGSDAVGPVTSVDVDSDGELYLVRQDGQIYRLAPTNQPVDSDHDGLPDYWELQFGLDPNDPHGDNGPNGDPDHDGITNLQEYRNGTHPRGVPAFTRYFAEGSNSNGFFETTIDLANPGQETAAVLMRFLKEDGSVVPYFVRVPAQRHVTVFTPSIPGLALGDFSTVIETDHEIVAERTMVWTPDQRYGSHTETAAKAPATQWFLAEGATHGAFDLFYLIENATDTPAQIEIKYLLPAPAAPVVIDYPVDPHSRRTIYVNQEPGLAATDVSGVVTSTNSVPVIVERAMYFSGGGITFRGGHDSAGVNAPSPHWFFAEGATGDFFDMFLLVANPDPAQTAHVTMTYLLPDGTQVPVRHDIEPSSRQTYNVQQEDPMLASTPVSTIVDSDVPVVAERSMYWPKPASDWNEASNATGATETGTKWVVAGGEEGGPFSAQTYVLVANTSNFAGTVNVTVLLEDGDPLVQRFTLPPNSRTNLPMGSTPGFEAVVGTRFGVIVESVADPGDQPAQIVIERSTYSNDSDGVVWSAGASTLGTKLQ